MNNVSIFCCYNEMKIIFLFSQLTREEEDRRRLRRQKNKLAAQKCRSKKRKLADCLEDVSYVETILKTVACHIYMWYKLTIILSMIWDRSVVFSGFRHQ